MTNGIAKEHKSYDVRTLRHRKRVGLTLESRRDSSVKATRFKREGIAIQV